MISRRGFLGAVAGLLVGATAKAKAATRATVTYLKGYWVRERSSVRKEVWTQQVVTLRTRKMCWLATAPNELVHLSYLCRDGHYGCEPPLLIDGPPTRHTAEHAPAARPSR